MAWVPCGISLKKRPPYSHVQQLNNCKQPDMESPCLKLSNGICLQNSHWGGGGGGRGEGFPSWPTPTDYSIRCSKMARNGSRGT